jgi:hypothetical protein
LIDGSPTDEERKVRLEAAIVETNVQLQAENVKLQAIVSKLQAKNHDLSLKVLN